MKKIFSTILFLVLTLMVSLVGCSNERTKESTSTAEENTTSYTSAEEVSSWINSTLRNQTNDSIGNISLSNYSAISKELNDRISEIPEESKPYYYALEHLQDGENGFFQIRICFSSKSSSDIEMISTLKFQYPYACVYFKTSSLEELKKELDDLDEKPTYSIGEENGYSKVEFYF